MYYVLVLAVLLSWVAEGGNVGGAGEGEGQRSEDQVWLKEILDPEMFDYNAARYPFEDLLEEDVPHALMCTHFYPTFQKLPASFSHITLPASTATLVVTMDLDLNGRIPGRDVSYPLTLCSPEACRTGKGDLVQVIVDENMVELFLRLDGQEIRRPLGIMQQERTTRVFFAVLQNKVLWRKENGETRQEPLQRQLKTRRYPFRAVFCGLEFMEASFRGSITNVMINYKQVMFSEWQTENNLKPPIMLGSYSRVEEYELSHAVVRCPRPYIVRLDFRLRNLKNYVHRRKDYMLMYVPYEARLQRAAGSGWGVVISRKNVIHFCYDVIHRRGCESYESPSLVHSDLRKLEITVVRGVLKIMTTTSPPILWKSMSLRQYAKPLPCRDKMYLGRLPDHLPHSVTRHYMPYQGRIGHITINKDALLNPKTYVDRKPRRVSMNVAMYAVPAMSVRGNPAQYVERRVNPGRSTLASCPPGVKGDWYDLTGRVLVRDKEAIRIMSPDDTVAEGVYACATRHPMLGYRVHTVTAVYYKRHEGAVAVDERLRETESTMTFQLQFGAVWVVTLAMITFLTVFHAAVSWTRLSRHPRRGGRRASVLSFLAMFNREYTWRRAHLEQRDLRGFVYQIHALHQSILARLTSEERNVMDPLKRLQKTGRSSIDLEKLFSEGQWEEAMEGQAEGPPSTSRYQPDTLASPLLTYPENYREIADELMVKEKRGRREAISPTSPPSTTLSSEYDQ